MMNKFALAVTVAVCCYSVLGQDRVKTGVIGGKENARVKWLKATGGRILKPNSARGKVVFVDYGNFLSVADYEKVLAQFQKDSLRYDYSLVRESGAVDFPLAKAKFGASVLVGFYADDKAPVLLAAPEDGWSAINVPKLMKGLDTAGAKEKFFGSRLRKETMRAFAYACGCGGSGFPNNTLSVETVQGLDYVNEFIPYDALQNIIRFSKERGLTPSIQTTYRKACQEGWAPAPTNEIQKAIWDKVHAIPDKPMKVKFDPAAQKGKVTK